MQTINMLSSQLGICLSTPTVKVIYSMLKIFFQWTHLRNSKVSITLTHWITPPTLSPTQQCVDSAASGWLEVKDGAQLRSMQHCCMLGVHACADFLIFDPRPFLFRENSTVSLCCLWMYNSYAKVSLVIQGYAKGWASHLPLKKLDLCII